jgi:hypothetical protein
VLNGESIEQGSGELGAGRTERPVIGTIGEVVAQFRQDLSRSLSRAQVEGFEMTDYLGFHFERIARNLFQVH